MTAGPAFKAWTRGVAFDEKAREQTLRLARLPFVQPWVAVMPDVHLGKGATIGSVIPSSGAIIPAAVGVDIGCGVMAVKTTLRALDLPDSLAGLRAAIERAVPHGRTQRNDRGAWGEIPPAVARRWSGLSGGFDAIVERHPSIGKPNHVNHLGTLGTGNHFIEVCLDEAEAVWVMLHSGSRGVGNRIGSYFIELAKEDMRRWFVNLPDADLAYLAEGTEHFDDYVAAVGWAQDYALANRELMMERILATLRGALGRDFGFGVEAVNCHHNYVARETHYGRDLWITRKGALRARDGDFGVIPGSMGACSLIVRGRGNPASFHSCSHGAGRLMSRTAARRRFSIEDHRRATAAVECRKDRDVIDETPAAYKPIEAVIEAQRDLVDVVHTLRQVVCVKG